MLGFLVASEHDNIAFFYFGLGKKTNLMQSWIWPESSVISMRLSCSAAL